MKDNAAPNTSSSINQTFLEETIAENKLPLQIEGKLGGLSSFRFERSGRDAIQRQKIFVQLEVGFIR